MKLLWIDPETEDVLRATLRNYARDARKAIKVINDDQACEQLRGAVVSQMSKNADIADEFLHRLTSYTRQEIYEQFRATVRP